MNCKLSSLEEDHKQFILSLHHNTLNNCSDFKNHHQATQRTTGQRIEREPRKGKNNPDILFKIQPVKRFQIAYPLRYDQIQALDISFISLPDTDQEIREKLDILLQRQYIIYERQQQPIDQVPSINSKQLKTLKFTMEMNQDQNSEAQHLDSCFSLLNQNGCLPPNSLVILVLTNTYVFYPLKFAAPHLFYSEMFEEDWESDYKLVEIVQKKPLPKGLEPDSIDTDSDPISPLAKRAKQFKAEFRFLTS
ncbi:hypothetical protein PPACK8108_LOCUS21227 [Phakopsora pachyrhizi]|uniref:Uncharacterized protein n=1 Tax=Phakopsora pachyrhizi TaxID=170000 RepID=A0AAV0BLW5_PHAPC|nr:hypothetical protein PPACK8108_LOCUS21227 [Phakopsora pachyrhizi]